MEMDRRALLGAGLAAGAALPLAAHAAAAAHAPDIITLWPGSPPGGGASDKPEQIGMEGKGKGALTGVSQPRLRVYRPARPNGTAVLIMGGGGYFRIQVTNESQPAGHWLASQGVTAFELIYRLPGDGWSRQAPFADAQRAMRLIRAGAKDFGIDPGRIGVLGFSAGGHLAAMTAAAPDAEHYPKRDAIDGLSARPSFAALLYPVITLKPPFDTTQTKRWLVGKEASAEDTRAWSVETHASPAMPPVFLAQNADDPIAAIDNSLIMFSACRQVSVPCEMHVFEKGGHGFGMGEAGSTDVAWSPLLLAWLKLRGLA